MKGAKMIPGEFYLKKEEILANVGRRTRRLVITNVGDRPIQVGSHFHFFEVNRALRFERHEAYGMRLNLPAGTAARFEPGEEKEVLLVAFGGNRRMMGLNGLTDGDLDNKKTEESAIRKAIQEGFSPKGGKK